MFFALPNNVRKRQYIVCDEASELEEQLVKEFTCNINYEYLTRSGIQLKPLPGDKDYNKCIQWLNSLSIDLDDLISDLKEAISSTSRKVRHNEEELKANYTIISKIQLSVKTLIETWYDSEYIIERHAKGVSFTPLKVDRLSKHIFDCGDKIVLMSATIIDPNNFCKTLGIEKFKYIEAESTFNANKAPIYVNTKTKLNYNNIKTQLPKIAKQIQEICNIHKNEKGIIHTQNNSITNFLRDNLHSDRVLFREPGVNNEMILDKHCKTSAPSILASPSMSFGVDLRDDLARFQILIKAPYLPITDKRVERMMKLDPNWYINKMLCSLIQSCGRGIRSSSDYCTTYILDASIAEILIKNKHKIDEFFI
jgi:Rad3-related DNA helicase